MDQLCRPLKRIWGYFNVHCRWVFRLKMTCVNIKDKLGNTQRTAGVGFGVGGITLVIAHVSSCCGEVSSRHTVMLYDSLLPASPDLPERYMNISHIHNSRSRTYVCRQSRYCHRLSSCTQGRARMECNLIRLLRAYLTWPFSLLQVSIDSHIRHMSKWLNSPKSKICTRDRSDKSRPITIFDVGV